MGGLLSRSTKGFNPEKDLLDLTGKVVIVTGANTGIGYQTVKFLARRGAKVYLGARSREKATAAIAQLHEEGIGSGQVEWLELNLSDPRWARDSAEEFCKKEKRLDILVNNAAQLTGKYEKTQDDISTVMVVNHFSPFVFIRALLPLMRKTSEEHGSDVRIVTLSSIGHTASRAMDSNIRFHDIEDFNHEYATDIYPEWSRYTVTKLMCLLFAQELQRRLDTEHLPILSIAIHPGEVHTFADRMPFPRLANVLMEIFFMRPAQGSYNSCFAAASPLPRQRPEYYKDQYLDPVGVIGKRSKNAKREDLQLELWETTERILRELDVKLPPL